MCVSHLDPICYTAGRLHVCLHCVFVGQRDRLAAHSERTGHYLFVDVSSKHVYCHTCADYVYDGEFERISRRTRAECVNPRAGAAMNSPWLPPTAKDRTAFSRHMEQQPVISSSFTPGQSTPRPASHTTPFVRAPLLRQHAAIASSVTVQPKCAHCGDRAQPAACIVL
jgi:hypothetical protein